LPNLYNVNLNKIAKKWLSCEQVVKEILLPDRFDYPRQADKPLLRILIWYGTNVLILRYAAHKQHDMIEEKRCTFVDDPVVQFLLLCLLG
jgi:hypothetical protein